MSAYTITSPSLPVLSTQPIEDERGTSMIVTRYGKEEADLISAELRKFVYMDTGALSGITGTTITEAAGQAIVALFGLFRSKDRSGWKAELKAYLEQYSDVNSWSPTSITIDGEKRSAYQLGYHGGSAVVADLGNVYLAVSARFGPEALQARSACRPN